SSVRSPVLSRPVPSPVDPSPAASLTVPPALRARTLSSGALEFGGALGDGGLTVRRLVLVDDALACGAVQLTAGSVPGFGRPCHVAFVCGLTEPADGRLE